MAKMSRGRLVEARNQVSGLGWLNAREDERFCALEGRLGRLETALLALARPDPGLDALRAEVQAVRDALAAARHRTCPVCGESFPEYLTFNRRPKAECPSCKALERHRLTWLYLLRRTALPNQRVRLLHFAPEPWFIAALRPFWNVEHVVARFDTARPSEGVDIQALPYEANSFDLILCSHVLEHVPDDARGIAELFRVLKPGGQAIVLVPVRGEATTFEDPAITSPEARTRHFGQFDHLRYYGRDIVDRLAAPGFAVELVNLWAAMEPSERADFGIRPETIFACRKGSGVHS